ncbi:MAG: exodeoxyribonuclease V subunit gamma [Chlamydiae bacterium]|nr:exodeoxyribonuclease V subunit gamma [Chlamydiota bacterium]
MQRVKQGKVFFSNHLEVLLELLIEELLLQDPFDPIKIVIPSREMGRWIKREIANRLGVAANIKTLFLNEILQSPLPSKLELTKAIYPKIANLDYVKKDEKRQMPLAQTVASFFLRYAQYGVTFEEDWQKELWNSLNLQPDLRVDGSFHLFAFSHIPEKLFEQLKNCTLYHLSPCSEFWSDLTKYDHTLLGSCGKVGRKFAAMVEESNITTEPYYLPPKSPSALHHLQRGMLQLSSEKIEGDESLAIHLVSTRKREIEVLHHQLLQMDVEPKDVLVMAPDIELYKPYIEAIFEKYQIADMPASTNLQVSGLLLIVALESRRYCASAFLELFRHPLFYRRWDEKQLEQIEKWITKTGIRFGIDGSYREKLFGRYEEAATLESGFDQLLEELIMSEGVAFTEAELLGEWIETTRQLYSRMPSGKKSLSCWVDEIRQLCSDFFVESEQMQWLFRKIELLRADLTLPFDSFMLLLQEELKGEGITINPNQLQVYRFSSMLPMRSIPAKVIWLLGMDQDAFPRLDHWLSFDLSRHSHTYSPSRIDFDRYLFLESLLSARERFIVSLIGRDPLDNQEKPPSSCVSDLLEHVDLEPIYHPAKSYDEPLSELDYEMAMALKKDPIVREPFSIVIAPTKLPAATVDIAELLRLARSPLKHYFANHLGLRFFEKPEVKDEEEFTLSPLTFARIQSEALNSSVEAAISRAKRVGGYPQGIFAEVANSKCSAIEEHSLYAIEWHEHITKAVQIDETLWHLPAPKVGSVTIVGRVEGVKDGVLFLPKKKSSRTLFSNWPLLHLFNEVHFLDDTVSIKGSLERYLRYFFETKEARSPLFPTWVKPILDRDLDRLQKEIEAPTFDQAWLLCSCRADFSLPQIVDTWQPHASEIFQEVLDEGL